MQIIERWRGPGSFPEWHSEAWDQVKNSILKLTSKELFDYRECTVEELNEEWIRFIFEKRGGETYSVECGTDELFDMNAAQFATILQRMKRFPNNDERWLLQLVFDNFIENNQWPKSRVIAVRVSDERLENYYKMSERIGRDYIVTEGPLDKNALSKLRVKGILLCSGSNDYLRLFVSVLQAFVERFREISDESRITTKELIERNIISENQRYWAHEMIVLEHELREAATYNNEGYATYEISPNVLDYINVQNVREYLRIVDKRETDVEEDFIRDMNIGDLENSIGEYHEMKQMEYDLFISYAKEDKEKATKINDKANKVGLSTFFAPKSIKGGEIGIEKIKDAIKASVEVVVLVSKNSLKSGWVFTEWGAAWILDKHITPLLYRCDEDDIPDLLKQPQFKDFDDLDDYLAQVLERKA